MTVQLHSSCMNKVTADKATLNNLASIFYEVANLYESQGYGVCADAILKDANTIYDALDKEGYYDDCPSKMKETTND